MNKKLVAAIVAGLTLAVTAPAFAAPNAFADVPKSHWAYDAVNTLAGNGVIDGYGDGTFKGDKLMTRYEMAQIVARANNNYDKARAGDRALMDKLNKEFQDELKALGVRVAALEKNQPTIKITGESRVRYQSDDKDKIEGFSAFDMRQRLHMNAKINENVSYTARLEASFKNGDNLAETVAFNRNFFTITDVGVDKILLGRMMALAGKNMNVGSSSNNDGIMLIQKAGDVNLTGFVLSVDNDATTADHHLNNEQFLGLYAGVNLGKKADLEVGYTKADKYNAKSFDIGAYTQLGRDFSLTGEYVHTSNDGVTDGNAWAVQLVKGVKANKIGSIVGGMNIVDMKKPHTSGYMIGYRDIENHALAFNGTPSIFYPTSFATAAPYSDNFANNAKGMYYGFQNVLAKNTILSLEYQDLEVESTGADLDKTFAAHVQFWF